MSVQPENNRLTVGEFADRIRHEMVPVNSRFSYFSTSLSLSEEDVREYLAEPIASLPPAVTSALPPVSILLVPFLERSNGKPRRGKPVEDVICFEKPAESKVCWDSFVERNEEEILAFGLTDQEMVDYHYRLFGHFARLTGGIATPDAIHSYNGLLREELSGSVHGEVDERSWRFKQGLLRRQTKVRRDSKAFVDYAFQSMIDTLTLYLHGICCDIDVETGPRQLPSRFLRRRLQLLQSLFPPPEGYAVFPEEASRA